MRQALVIGGGLAGAAAALEFADAGWTVTVVEARDRLGGRAFSPRWDAAGGPVELGGSWIRADHAAMRTLAERLGQPLTPRPAVELHRPPLDATASAALHTALAAGAPDPDQTLAAWMDRHALPPGAQRELLAWWAISGSGDPADVAASELVTPKVRAGLMPRKLDDLAFTFPDGAQALAEAAIAASGARVMLDTAVTGLTDTGTAVTARLASGDALAADAAVVAVPLNVLRRIDISPPLSPDQSRLAAIGHAGRAIKLVISATGVAPGTLATGNHAGLRWMWADRSLPHAGTLVIAFGAQDDVPDPDAAARAAIPAAFPGAALQDLIWHDWCADPLALGAWVAPRAGYGHLHTPAAWGRTGRIAFAGSDTAGDEAGWFEGAVVTGQAAARSLS